MTRMRAARAQAAVVRRAPRAVTATAVGTLLALAAVVGMDAASEPSRPPQPDEPEPLDLDGYCQELHGEDARGYQPSDLDGWQCSVWINGVWGLERADLAAVCRWQLGTDARLEARRQVTTGAEPSKRELTCTL